MMSDFTRIAIVNRGEPAMRLISAVRELNAQHKRKLTTIAFYTAADRSALYVREADEAFSLGDTTFVDPRDGQRKSSYLDYQRLREALRASRAGAAWVGWGFVAEHPEFASLCEELGVTFIGPPAEVMRRLGDKIASKQLAERAEVPVSPWSGGAVESLEAATEVAQRIGYPLVIKASAGGGGRGIRVVHEAEDLAESYKRARSEAGKSFGDDTVFIERMITGARHVEVQIIADNHGTCWAAGVRDCTVQRRHQKLIEEGPPPTLPQELQQQLTGAAVRLALAAGYRNAGTVECLYEQQGRRFYFMEMNTRLQVEHPVTECTTGIDLVKLQLHVARGGRLEGEPPAARGHAIEVRLNAEDPDNNFAPAPGRVQRFSLPSGPGIRVDAGVREGDTIPPDFDSMVAKFIAWGRDRSEAIARLQRALSDCLVLVDDGTTNKAFLLELLGHRDIVSSEIDIKWLDRLMDQREHRLREHADLALLSAAIDIYETEHEAERAQFISSAARGRPKIRQEVGLPVELSYHGHSYRISVRGLGAGRFQLIVDGTRVSAELDRRDEHEGWLHVGGERHRRIIQRQGLGYRIEIDGVPHRVLRDDGGMVRAPAPALVVSVNVEEGQVVKTGDRMLVLEAMKMELPVAAPSAGRVRQLLVSPNVQVDAAAPLLLLEQVESDRDEERAERIAFRGDPTRQTADLALATDETFRDLLRSRYHENLGQLRLFLLGYDIARIDARGLVRELASLQVDVAPDDEETASIEHQLLAAFVDIISLYGGSSNGGDHINVSRPEELSAYFRSMAPDSLQPELAQRLERAVAHYDVTSLERSIELEDALLWSYRAFKRGDQMVRTVSAILERRLEQAQLASKKSRDELRELLQRTIDMSRDRFLGLHDLAQQVWFCYYHQPLFERSRTNVYEQVVSLIERAVNDPEGEQRDRSIKELATTTQPVAGFLAQWLETCTDAVRALLVEALLLRFYRALRPKEVQRHEIDGISLASAWCEKKQATWRVVSLFCQREELGRALSAAAELQSAARSEAPLAVDLFVSLPDAPVEELQPDDVAEQQAALLERELSESPLAGHATRVCFCLVSPEHRRALSYLTYLFKDGAYAERGEHRGIHPMWVERLEIWRLQSFDCTRLPAAEDIYLYRAIARENPKDERLFAFVDVRDLTQAENSSSQIELPHFGRMFLEAMASLRDFQYRRPPHRRLQWNRVLFYFWPQLQLSSGQLGRVMSQLAPATVGLGLEKVVIYARVKHPRMDTVVERAFHFFVSGGQTIRMRIDTPSRRPIQPLRPYAQRVVRARARGFVYPYEIIRMLTPETEGTTVLFRRGDFVEHELDEHGGRLLPIERPFGENRANVVVGVIRNFTTRYPEGIKRVIILGDPTRAMGALAEPECRRIIAAFDLAESLGVPVEWFPISAGAKISLESGTENLDWTARVLRRLIEFTQAGGEVNVVLDGINVGAQSYWNAEATMLMHTRGILVMTPQATMVLTGKRALDYSGGVSAEDNRGIGGVERTMGPNGQAQYTARDLTEACMLLFQHYDLTYKAPGERFPRRANTIDPADRDITEARHEDPDGLATFDTVGEIFSAKTNPLRKRPFDMRSVMRAVIDRDHTHLERWAGMRDAEVAITWDAHIGGYPVSLLGIESKPLRRVGFIAADGPQSWTGGTLFPLSSKKIARAINAASGNRPVVILANLSGFDGSPESMRTLQLEYGAEIGRAVVNFDGPMLFCVISRYHGGAYVVFSRTLNEQLEIAAVEGSYASVIGGAAASAVVLGREVKARAYSDPRVRELQDRLGSATEQEKRQLRTELNAVLQAVQLEKQTQVAREFDEIHSVARAQRVGSIDQIVSPSRLRFYLIEALERGILVANSGEEAKPSGS